MNQEHIGLFSALIAAGVEFAVVGGVAVNAHGYLRATHDLDVFIRPTEENARAVWSRWAFRWMGWILRICRMMNRTFASAPAKTTSTFWLRLAKWGSIRCGATVSNEFSMDCRWHSSRGQI
jgi:hypothetical protein